MPDPSDRMIRQLVQQDRVHRDVYADPRIFDLEMERIFGRAWLLLGHDSQVPEPGDFITGTLGRQPVIMVRQRDGTVKVLFNRCTHRGTALCSARKGSVKQFVCPYHGWTFSIGGGLQGVPVPEGYGDRLEKLMEERNLPEAPRVRNYRGFVFASLAGTGPSLEEFLGPLASSLDDLVDRSPTGDVEVAGGVARHVYNGNWKLVLENHTDAIHPRYVHASSVAAANDQPEDVPSDGMTGEVALRQMRQNGAPNEVWENLGLWAAPNGHSFMGDYHDDKKLVTSSGDPTHEDYRRRMTDHYGKERADEILGVTRWNSIIFPNVSFMSQFGQLRIVQPVAVDRTIVNTYVFRLKGAPDAMYRRAIAFANVVNGIGSPVLTDDLEVYERIQVGLHTEGTEWIDYSRGLGRDQRVNGVERGATGTSEVTMRNQFKAWVDYMAAEA